MRRITMRAVALLLAASTAGGCYLFQKSETYYGTHTAGKSVAFVLDVSGSMEGKSEGSIQDRVTGAAVDAGGRAIGGAVGGPVGTIIGRETASEATKLGAAKRELIPAIQGLSDSSRFTIITFGQDVEAWPTGLVDASTGHRTAGMAYVKGLESNGGTPAMRALEQALQTQGIDVIFFVSDGRPTDGGDVEILRKVQQLNPAGRTVIHTIGLGDDQDEAFLRALASQNGGTYTRK